MRVLWWLMGGVLSVALGLGLAAASTKAAPAGEAKAAPVPEANPQLLADYMQISPQQIPGNVIQMIGSEWMLITAGSPEKFNSMTASWGGLGVWDEPTAFVLVHPARYTYEFLEREQYFSLSFFDHLKYAQVMGFQGVFGNSKKSGRTTDKVKESGFHPLILNHGVSYTESRLIVICRKRFSTFSQPDSTNCHKFFFGKIEAVWIRKDYAKTVGMTVK